MNIVPFIAAILRNNRSSSPVKNKNHKNSDGFSNMHGLVDYRPEDWSSEFKEEMKRLDTVLAQKRKKARIQAILLTGLAIILLVISTIAWLA